MIRVHQSSILFVPGGAGYEIFTSGEITAPKYWCEIDQRSCGSEEEQLKTFLSQPSREHPRHIRSITLAASRKIAGDFFREQGYFDDRSKQFTIPLEHAPTIGVYFRHLMWSSQDKYRLPNHVDAHSLRDGSDRRSLCSAVQEGLISAIYFSPQDLPYFPQAIEAGVLPLKRLTHLTLIAPKLLWAQVVERWERI